METEQEQSMMVGAAEGLRKSDLISGVYEGGLKVWDCTFDALSHISTSNEKKKDWLRGKSVLELGCGQGLPGILCGALGAKEVFLQDYNPEVITLVT